MLEDGQPLEALSLALHSIRAKHVHVYQVFHVLALHLDQPIDREADVISQDLGVIQCLSFIEVKLRVEELAPVTVGAVSALVKLEACFRFEIRGDVLLFH